MAKKLSALLDQPLQGLLFDLDGTLVDSVPDLAVAVDAMLAAANLPLAGESRVRTWVGNGAKVLVQKALAFAQNCELAELDDAELAQQQQQFFKYYRQSSGQHSALYAGVMPALQHWHSQGIAMAVVTNKPAEFIPHILKQFALEDFFTVCLGGDSLPQRKPQPAPLIQACAALAVPLDRCVMIGDSQIDVAAARAAGMPVACVNYGYNQGQPISAANPDVVVGSLLELCA
ncbi:phosphoglycolate phosphatase [Dasania sp. GY-MA-18]|uniref:Phosphoglycolate phosphatase n=1 Tax=Dasania phycosphaerae TaxID=2950436 RepID=A0A9J6RKI0_9GAMM|nr:MULTISPECIES: phosphoglycolate phosphatase [Dasania]MCR8922308.1 phosphoglycolate phosphatase [Dasania sp. GY-MA-18]MCZ0864736.1 phosphoglycolate phosphatase [Dasania phycosphaerae]MCZ0868464.1 phosphoglycolate phosphatase [Dasania phycosphaerae]